MCALPFSICEIRVSEVTFARTYTIADMVYHVTLPATVIVAEEAMAMAGTAMAALAISLATTVAAALLTSLTNDGNA